MGTISIQSACKSSSINECHWSNLNDAAWAIKYYVRKDNIKKYQVV